MSIYLVLAIALLNSISVSAARVVLALYALELGARPFTVGILAATFSVFPMLLAMPAGRMADRFGARWLLVFGAFGGGLGMWIPYLAPALPAIFAAAAMIGLSTTIYNVSTQNLVGLLSNPQNRARNFSNYSLIGSISNIGGPLIAGFSIDHWGHGTACLYLALFTLVPVTLLASRGHTVRTHAPQAKQRAPGGIRAMVSEPGVRSVLVTTSLLQTGNDLYKFYMPIYTHAIGLSASAIGMVLATNSAAGFAVRLVLPRLMARFKEEQLLAYAFYMGACSLALVPLFKDAVMLGLISFIFGIGMGCGQPIIMMMMFSSSAEGRSGEALGLRMSVNHLTKVVAPVVFGFVGSVFGLFPMFWINALMMGAGGIVSRPKSAGHREKRDR